MRIAHVHSLPDRWAQRNTPEFAEALTAPKALSRRGPCDDGQS